GSCRRDVDAGGRPLRGNPLPFPTPAVTGSHPAGNMKQFLEYIPLIFFLVFYKMEPRPLALGESELVIGGIYSATSILMLSTVLVYGAFWLLEGSLSRMQWIVVGAVLIFGSSTLLLRSEDILKWKAPVVNWIIAAIFLGSQFLARENMSKSMFGHI